MQVKGTAVASIPIFIREKFGEEGFKRWLDSISPEASKVYSSSILVSSWYPLKEILVEPSANICKLFYNGNLSGVWECGRFSAEYGLRGIYKIFVKFGSPGFLIKRASIILPTYYKPSAIEVIENTRDYAILHITQFPEINKLIEFRIAGWMEHALEISGCKDVEIKITKSLTEGDPYTEFQDSWK